jgi:hypothetical protein
MEGAIEGAHMGHPDFRVNGRIFASLRANNEWGMVKLTPEEQQAFVAQHPGAFSPENGAWGRQGYTAVRLDGVGEDVLGEAMTLAWRSTSSMTPPRARAPRGSPRRGLRPVSRKRSSK